MQSASISTPIPISRLRPRSRPIPRLSIKFSLTQDQNIGENLKLFLFTC